MIIVTTYTYMMRSPCHTACVDMWICGCVSLCVCVRMWLLVTAARLRVMCGKAHVIPATNGSASSDRSTRGRRLGLLSILSRVARIVAQQQHASHL
jgi:hypothetical protein